MFNALIHALVALTFPPLLMGVIIKTKAAFAGRVGAPMPRATSRARGSR